MSAFQQPLRALRSSRLPTLCRPFSSTPAIKADSAGAALFGDLTKPTTRQNSLRSPSEAMIERLGQRNSARMRAGENATAKLEITRLREMEKTLRRQWKGGEVYAPHDLSPSEARKWATRTTPIKDIFDELAIDPMKEWKVCRRKDNRSLRVPAHEMNTDTLLQNPSMMYEFQTPLGRIKNRRLTGLRPVNQRRIARAIRRGIGMGFLPSVHAHPEVLRRKGIKFTTS